MMISAAIISMLEKELVSHSPEIEAFVLKCLSTLANDLLDYVEKKIAPAAATSGD